MKLFIFNGNYAVIAETKEEAKQKLAPYLKPEHKWYVSYYAEDLYSQGHLKIWEKEIIDDVIRLYDF